MQHHFIDRYADRNSVIHGIDPRLKTAFSFAFVLCIALTPASAYLYFAFYGCMLFSLALLSKVPLRFILKKSLTIIPFVAVVAAFIPFFDKRDGFTIFASVIAKSYLSFTAMILLTSTTKFVKLLKALEDLKAPQIFIMIMSFMYRYLFVLVDEAQRMERAIQSRSYSGTKRPRILKAMANMAGVLFIRSYERAERVYLAMCSRGFTGRIKTLD